MYWGFDNGRIDSRRDDGGRVDSRRIRHRRNYRRRVDCWRIDCREIDCWRIDWRRIDWRIDWRIDSGRVHHGRIDCRSIDRKIGCGRSNRRYGLDSGSDSLSSRCNNTGSIVKDWLSNLFCRRLNILVGRLLTHVRCLINIVGDRSDDWLSCLVDGLSGVVDSLGSRLRNRGCDVFSRLSGFIDCVVGSIPSIGSRLSVWVCGRWNDIFDSIFDRRRQYVTKLQCPWFGV